MCFTDTIVSRETSERAVLLSRFASGDIIAAQAR